MNENYRARIYTSYVRRHMAYRSGLTREEYAFEARLFRRRFSSFLPVDKEASILELGCGAGKFLFFLQQRGYANAIGVDASAEQLEVARKFGVRNVELGDAFEFLRNAQPSHDLICAFDVLEHLKKEEVFELLDLTRRVLKPGGDLLISVPNAGSLLGSYAVYRDFTHEVGFTAQSLAQVLRTCGFEDVKVYPEGPVCHDLRSAMRVALWRVARAAVRAYYTIQSGTGRGLWKQDLTLEPHIFAVARNPDNSKT